MDYSQLLSYDFDMPVIVSLAVALAATVLWLCLWLPYVKRPGRAVKEQDDPAVPDNEPVDGVSVIVYANNDGETTEQLLVSILSQELVGAMEVIVVNDGSYDSTRDIVGRLELKYSNLYMTYAPDNSRNLSRRKLALTLGVKAARYDKLVFTTGNAMIPSSLWLQRMTAPMQRGGADVVLGYAYPDAAGRDRGAMRVRAFDSVWEAISWLAPALSGHPTRGIGANLAYRTKLFFDNKGFSNSLNLVDGDDDIFVSEITAGHATAVVLADCAQVGIQDWNPGRRHRLNKLSRRFTGKRIASWPRARMAAGSLMAWVSLLASVAGGYLGWPSAIPAAAAFVLQLCGWIPSMLVWRSTSRALHSRPLMLTVMPLLLWHPFYNLFYAARSRRTRLRNFTWNEG